MEQGLRLADFMPIDGQAVEEGSANLERLLPLLRRQWRVVAASVLAGGAAGLLTLLASTPIYTASASLIIDTGNRQIAHRLSASADRIDDERAILGQLELLRSEKIALGVARRLDLAHEQAFRQRSSPAYAWFAKAVAPVAASLGIYLPPPDPPDIRNTIGEDRLLRMLAAGLSVTRASGTAVLRVDYASPRPDLSARIVRMFVRVYLADQVEANTVATRNAGEWLQTRIADLRREALATDLAVQKYRADNGLLSPDGRLVSDQQLSQVNAALAAAKSTRADAEAKFGEIGKIITSGDLANLVPEALSNPVITDLRSRYVEASRKQAEIAGRLGEDHGRARQLRADMGEYRRLMFEELGRTARTFENDVKVARARQQSLEAQLSSASTVSVGANDSQVQLRQLEREADSTRQIYQTYLQRYQEALQQQTFPLTEVRVISEARTPTSPSSPRVPVTVTLSLFAGLLAGVGIGALREWRDRGFRTAAQVREFLGLQAIGFLQTLDPAAAPTGEPKGEPPSLRHPRIVDRRDPRMRHAVDHPLSAFAETIRAIRLAIDARLEPKHSRTVGVVSVLPGEGKSTAAANLALFAAAQGARVLLVDADLRNPGLTRQIGPLAERGLVETLADSAVLREVLMIDPVTKLGFLPAVVKRRITHSSELLASEGMDRLLRDLGATFDYVIFDLPPLVPIVDSRAMMAKLDCCVLVVEWGQTPRSLVRDTLREHRELARKCVGVVVNKVDPARMRLYRMPGSPDLTAPPYGRYYID